MPEEGIGVNFWKDMCIKLDTDKHHYVVKLTGTIFLSEFLSICLSLVFMKTKRKSQLLVLLKAPPIDINKWHWTAIAL